MYSSETDLPPRPDPQTGEPRPPQPPRVLGLSRDSAKTTASAGAPPTGRGPALAVHGDEWWSAPVAALVLSIITAIIFSFESDDWFVDPFSLGLVVLVFVVTLAREWKVKIVGGADWLRVNNNWVDTYRLTHIELRGLWFGWMLRLKDSDGRRVRTYMSDLEANPELWALAYNGMLHSAYNGAHVNNMAAGILRLKPGFEAMRHQARRTEIPRRTIWTLLLVVVVVFAAIYLLRPHILGMALAVFAGIVITLTAGTGIALTIVRRKQKNHDA